MERKIPNYQMPTLYYNVGGVYWKCWDFTYVFKRIIMKQKPGRNCQVSDFIWDTDTFTTKANGEKFKIQSGILNCNSQKVVYLLKFRICGEAPYVGKAKPKFRTRFNNYKSTHRS